MSPGQSWQGVADHLNLTHLLDYHPFSLSGGEKQRVVVASALVAANDVLILDEPSAGLDYGHMRALADLIYQLKKASKVVILISHDLELIDLLADQVVDLNQVN